MSRILRILRALLVLMLGSIAVLAIVISHDSACGTAAPPGAGETPMKGFSYRCYGGPEVMQRENLAKPVPADEQVLVRVRAASVNPLDWHTLRGAPYIMRLGTGIGAPSSTRLGVDFAGVVESVGARVTRFKPGDAVFGGAGGSFADYVTVHEGRAIAMKPDALSFEQAAAIPIAATTALQALRDQGKLRAGEKVLVNGASGGVGTFAVQIAKALGAEVTGVCSDRNLALVRSLGADHVIDYNLEDFTESEQRYDLVVDMVGNRGLLEIKRVLAPDGRLVIIGGPRGNWIGPMTGAINAFLLSPFVKQEMGMMLARLKQDDLDVLRELADDGKLTPVIDRTYAMEELPAAIAYLEQGRARGKVVIVNAAAADLASPAE